MIAPEELRIGNWINNCSGQVKISYTDMESFEDCQPIPLTPEILEKCGFENGNKEVANCDLWDKWWLGDFEISFENGSFEYVTTTVKYLHHLQNLYFALTGTELNYQP